MRRSIDLRCEQGHILLDQFCEGEPPCTECQSPTSVYWGNVTEVRRVDNFSTIVFGGERYETREDWNNHKAEWKRQHGQELHVEGDSRTARLARLDDAMHSQVQHAQRRGMGNLARDVERAGSRR